MIRLFSTIHLRASSSYIFQNDVSLLVFLFCWFDRLIQIIRHTLIEFASCQWKTKHTNVINWTSDDSVDALDILFVQFWVIICAFGDVFFFERINYNHRQYILLWLKWQVLLHNSRFVPPMRHVDDFDSTAVIKLASKTQLHSIIGLMNWADVHRKMVKSGY